jgi:hypothetical protein
VKLFNSAGVGGPCSGVAEHSGLLERYTLSLVGFVQIFGKSLVLSLSGTIMTVKKALRSFDTSVTTHSMAESQVSEDLNFQYLLSPSIQSNTLI